MQNLTPNQQLTSPLPTPTIPASDQEVTSNSIPGNTPPQSAPSTASVANAPSTAPVPSAPSAATVASVGSPQVSSTPAASTKSVDVTGDDVNPTTDVVSDASDNGITTESEASSK